MCANALDMALPKRSSIKGGGDEGVAGGALSNLTSGLGRMGSIGVGMLKSRFSSLGGGLVRLGRPVRIKAPDMVEDEESTVKMAISPKKSSTSPVSEGLEKALPLVLSFLSEVEVRRCVDVRSRTVSFLTSQSLLLLSSQLLTISSLVCNTWWDVSVECQAHLMLVSVGCEDQRFELKAAGDDDMDSDSNLDSDDDDDEGEEQLGSVALSMRRPWNFLNENYPWAAFLSEGAFKRVYRVYNSRVGGMEAVSVMDLDLIESTGNKQVVGAELAVSTLLSSLVRKNVCPNFILTRRIWTMEYEPPASYWGEEDNKAPRGKKYNPRSRKNAFPKHPSKGSAGRFQYIAMELCAHGDVESYLADQVGKTIPAEEARIMLFQMAVSLHVAKEKFNLVHYDVKNLNFLLQDANEERDAGGDHTHILLRYCIGDDVFNLKMERERATVAKLADYGTASLREGVEELGVR